VETWRKTLHWAHLWASDGYRCSRVHAERANARTWEYFGNVLGEVDVGDDAVAGRLFRAFDLEADRDGDSNAAARHLSRSFHSRCHANSRSREHWSREPQLFDSCVDDRLAIFDYQKLWKKNRYECDCEIAVGDGRLEGGFPLGSLDVAMNPLAIPGSFRKGVDLLLGNFDPVRRAEFAIDQIYDGCHV